MKRKNIYESPSLKTYSLRFCRLLNTASVIDADFEDFVEKEEWGV